MEDLRPKGILFVKLIEAKHVPKMDVFSQSDAYVRYPSACIGISHYTPVKYEPSRWGLLINAAALYLLCQLISLINAQYAIHASFANPP